VFRGLGETDVRLTVGGVTSVVQLVEAPATLAFPATSCTPAAANVREYVPSVPVSAARPLSLVGTSSALNDSMFGSRRSGGG